jgi:hypothetical protein
MNTLRQCLLHKKLIYRCRIWITLLFQLSFPVRLDYSLLMDTAAILQVAKRKLFAVAPMMDGNDNPNKSITYETPCAQRVQ